MIRTLLVDDEMPALMKLRSLLVPYDNYEVCGAFTDAQEALNQLSVLKPQVAFLDIAMPGINGMDLAIAIHQKLGNAVHIVFVSAYDEYALSAFEVRATDYLLKPVSRARFEQTIHRLNELFDRERSTEAEPLKHGRMLRTFGKLEIEDGQRAFGSWHTAKVRELFAFFIHNRERGAYRDAILETLWPHMSPERALGSMNTCNYYLRKQLEESGMGIELCYSSGYYTLNLNGAQCDADILASAAAQASPAQPSPVTAANVQALRAAAELYRGPYFEDIRCEWADLAAQGYASDYVTLRTSLAQYALECGNLAEAEKDAIQALDVSPLHMECWRLLLACYRQKGDPVSYLQAQSKLVDTYRKTLGTEPPEEFLKPF